MNARLSLTEVRSVVIKLGTAVLSTQQRRLDVPFVISIAKQINTLRERGIAVTVVSSGAIGAGLAELQLASRPKDLPRLQAVAAVGQRLLLDAWATAFTPHGLHVAQVLLTREDINQRQRFLNLRNTIHAANAMGAIAVVNENDTISTDEIVRISFGDNDILAASVAGALRADLLVILSNVDGVLDGAGRTVAEIDKPEKAAAYLRAEKSDAGRGGMASKLEAARMMTRGGEQLIVANGRTPDILPRLLDREPLGTLFLPGRRDKTAARARWIAAARPEGKIIIDAGAERALLDKKVSLLPAGVVNVNGHFAKGEVVAIVGSDGGVLAHGLTNYPDTDLLNIRGKKTAEVRTIMGDRAYDEVVHRDNLVLID